MRRIPAIACGLAAATLIGLLAGCGGSSSSSPQGSGPATEFRPPGDIPDDQVFVDYKVPGSAVVVRVPEGWAKRTIGGTTTFTDHYNSVAVQVVRQPKPPTLQSATSDELPTLSKDVSNFKAGDVTSAPRAHGNAILVTYQQDSAPDPTTGKVVRDAVERYEFWKNGQEAILTLTGPTNADNVDPWRIVSDSLEWR
jgi:hypothetical protein